MSDGEISLFWNTADQAPATAFTTAAVSIAKPLAKGAHSAATPSAVLFCAPPNQLGIVATNAATMPRALEMVADQLAATAAKGFQMAATAAKLCVVLLVVAPAQDLPRR